MQGEQDGGCVRSFRITPQFKDVLSFVRGNSTGICFCFDNPIGFDNLE